MIGVGTSITGGCIARTTGGGTLLIVGDGILLIVGAGISILGILDILTKLSVIHKYL